MYPVSDLDWPGILFRREEIPNAAALLAAEPALAADLGQVFTTHDEPLTPEDRAYVITAICGLVVRYREERSRNQYVTARRAEFQQWHTEALARVEKLIAWLDDVPELLWATPNPGGNAFEQLAQQRRHLLRELRDFEYWLRWLYDGRARRGRPADWIRADLEESIGALLHTFGLVPTMTEDGLYASILRDAVHPAIGLPERNHAAFAAVRAAIRNHKEWRK